jgi:uncharacterized membrane protein
MDMANSHTQHAIIATFDSSAQAEQAANDLMDWDKINPQINLGTIGVLTKNNKGEIKTKSYGARNTGKGAKIGVGVGVMAAVLSGGLTLIPTAIGGAIAGAAAGSLSRKGLGLTDAQAQQLNSELDGGRAAVLVMCAESEVKAIGDYLALEGGRTMSLAVDSAELEAASKTADSAEEQSSSPELPKQ